MDRRDGAASQSPGKGVGASVGVTVVDGCGIDASLDEVGVADKVGVGSGGAGEGVALGVAGGASVGVAVAFNAGDGVVDSVGVTIVAGCGVGASLDGAGVAEEVGVGSGGAGEGVALGVAGGASVGVTVAVSEGDGAGTGTTAGAGWESGEASVGAIGASVIEAGAAAGGGVVACPASFGAMGCIRVSGGANAPAEFSESSADGRRRGALPSSDAELSAAGEGVGLGRCSSSASAVTWYSTTSPVRRSSRCLTTIASAPLAQAC